MDIYSSDFIITILINLVITVIGYCIIPIILRITKGKLEYSKGHKIILINCAIVWLIFTIIKIEQGINSTSGAVILYYFINKAILLKPKTDNKKNNEDEEKTSVIDRESVKVEKEQNIVEGRIEKNEEDNTLATDNKVLYIIVFVLLVIIIGLSIYTVNAKVQAHDLESQISKLKSENSRLKNEKNDYFIDSITNGVKANFLDENIVFVIDGYGRYYYTYDQMEQVTQGLEEYSYWAYNKEQAKGLGYKAWKK